jgi:hypothetical protein
MTLQTRAEFLAGQGDAAGVETTITELRRVFAALPDKVTEDQISTWGWPEHTLRFSESFAYSLLGDSTRAHNAIDKALRLCPGEKAGGRANLELMRALALVHEREVTEGLRHAVTTCRSLPTSLARRRIAGEIIKALPNAKARAHPSARQLQSLTAAT